MNEISIKEFVKETLIEISEGIMSAQQELWEQLHNFPIAPNKVDGEQVAKASSISFDIALTTSTNEKSQKNGGIKIKEVDASLGKENNISKELISRIQFDVPFYPHCLHKKTKK